MGIFDRLKRKKPTKDKAVKPVVKQDKPKGKELTEAAKSKKEAAQDKKSALVSMKKPALADKIIIRPVITEKATSLSQFGQYVFHVPKTANRIEIAKAVRSIYKVNPVKVNIVNVSGKNVRYGKSEGRTKDWKKAIVTLKNGESISIQDGV